VRDRKRECKRARDRKRIESEILMKERGRETKSVCERARVCVRGQEAGRQSGK